MTILYLKTYVRNIDIAITLAPKTKLGQLNRGHSDVNNMLWDIRHLINVNLNAIVINRRAPFQTIQNIEHVVKRTLQLIIYHAGIMPAVVEIVVLEVQIFVKMLVKHSTLRNFPEK